MAQILVVDDEIGIRELLSEILADEGHQVMLAESAGDARKLRERSRPDLVLLDIWMPDTDGITLLKEWAASGQLTMPVVMMSGHGTIETAVEATRIGALDFLEKPIALQRLLSTVKRALRSPEAAAAPRLALAALGRSPALADTKKRLAQLAQSAAPLLLRGERGMRPELFARLLAAPAAAFLSGAELLAEPPSDLLAKAAGGVLFLPDLTRLGRVEQRSLEFLLARGGKTQAAGVGV
jgi:DNA-binding NtrC family response regulator